jgi:hypothetical protein
MGRGPRCPQCKRAMAQAKGGKCFAIPAWPQNRSVSASTLRNKHTSSRRRS